MVTGYGATLHQTSLTDNFARLAESGGSKYTPISPDRFIRPNEIPYSVDELAALNAQDLERIGISVDEVLEKIGLEEKILLKAEKNSSFETVMGWVDGYWEAMNRSLEKRQARSHNKEDVFYADVRLRAAGVKAFLGILPKYTNAETLEQVSEILVTASSICILAEVNAGNLNLESVLKSATIGSAVDLGLTKPESFDEAIKLLSAGHMESVGLFNDIESLLDGIKAEIIAGRIVSEYRFPDIGYGMNFKKSPAYRDVTDGADFELTILDGRFAKELALFDVKKAENSNSQGSCRVVSEGNTAKIYEADFEKPSNIDLYNIEENFIRAIIRNKTSGIVIRLPRGLVTGHSAKELMEMDIDQDLDYNEAKSHIYRELGYVLERVGK